MLFLRTLGSVCGTALVVTLSCAGAQTTPLDRLTQAQELRQQGHYEEARKALAALLREAQKKPDDIRFAAIVMDNMGLNELNSGNYTAAETAFNHGLSALPAAPLDDPILIDLKTHLAELYITEQRPEDAEPLVRKVAAVLHSSTFLDPIALARAYDDIAASCIMQHKFRDPETLLRQSMALVEDHVGPEDPRMASSLLTYAGFLTAEHRYSEAAAPAERAWNILQNAGASIPKDYLASASIVLSMVYFHLGREEDAVAYARQSVNLAEVALGETHPRLGLYLANYATILRHTNHKKEAKQVQERADAIMASHPAADVNGSGYTVNIASLR